jgi:L-seryl-tRNA(Ser) seleniumtransferase
MREASGSDLRRRLPSVDQLLQEPAVRDLEERHGRGLVRAQLRELLEELRSSAASGDETGFAAGLAALTPSLARRVERAAAPSLVPVINATGVIVHTNLGRAPLSAEAAERVALIARSYSNLEYDLEHGDRGRRETHAETRLRSLVGSESVVVVNNNAAAVMLAVNTFAEGREAIVSRGELVEIGGSFRVPDVLRKGGARLREVGTTNRTRVADYEAALGPEAALILKVHPSNFRIVGFTESPPLEDLVALARRFGIPLVEDLGSGLIDPLASVGDEPAVAARLHAGVDVVTFSGDKLLGGPQAGFAVGRREHVDRMRRNPLYRALRVDKMTLAALDVVLAAHESGHGAERVPVLRMLEAGAAEIRARAEAFAAARVRERPALRVTVRAGASAVGGGAAPGVELPTSLLSLAVPGPDRLAAALREAEPPVVARVVEDQLVLDLRTVFPEQEPALRAALLGALARLESQAP